jgi:hypothetical protein
MFNEWTISGTLGFVTGGAFMWFAKTAIQKLVLGANALSAKLHAQAAKIAPAVPAATTVVATAPAAAPVVAPAATAPKAS